MAIDPKAIPTVVNRFGTTTLAADLNQPTTTSCTLTDATGLPDGNIGGCIQIEDEIIYFESRVGNVLSTLRRGQDGTTAVAHASGAIVTSRIVAGNFNSLKSAVLELDTTKFELPAGGTVDDFIDGTGAIQPIPTLFDADNVVIPVRNATGTTLAKGTVVYIVGNSGNKILVAPADADDENSSSKTIGLVRSQILNNSEGFVVLTGTIELINTTPYTAGQPLYLSQTPGQFTGTKPISPAHLVQIGFADIIGNSSSGSIFVRIDNGYELEELHDVLVTSPTANQVLKWNGTNLWTNQTLQISDTSGLQTALDSKVDENAPITGATKTKITYDAKGLVTAGSDATTDDIAEGAINKYYPAADAAKLAGIEPGAEVNNISDVNALDLTDGGDSSLHFHSSDRNRANHTGTQTANTISDFDTEVANNTAVAANTAKVSADGSINTHSDVDTSTTPPVSGQALVWNGTTWVPDDVVVDPAGANTQIQFNDNGVFGASANLTYDGALNVKGAGSTGATQTLRLTNSSATNLFTMNDDGTFIGRYIAIGEYTGATRIGESAAPSATGNSWTAIGLNAGSSSTTGSFWTAIGRNAGSNNSTGNSWTAIGSNAGYSNTTGISWTAIGISAGFSNTTGGFWTAIGINSGYSNTTGISWTSIGTSAGRSNTTGSFWTAIGSTAAYSNTTGSGWVAIGTNSARYQSGTANTDLIVFNNGTYLGSETHGTEGSTNETVIGYAAEGNGSNTVTIGSNAVTANYFRGRIETTSSGTTSATQALKLTNSAATNLFTMNDDGTFNGKNIAIGEYTGGTRIGQGSGPNATGSNWTAIGSDAALNSITGIQWVAIGRNAGRSNTTGNDWTSIGRNAGYSNIAGSSWTAIGSEAALNNLSGGSWVAIGQNAGRYIKGTSSSLQYFGNCTYIGTNTKGTNGTDIALTDNETVIGYAAEGNGSNTVTIGSSAVVANYFRGRIETTSSGTTSATQALKLTNSAATNLFTITDDGKFNGRYIAIGEYAGATRIGQDAALNATGNNWTAIGAGAGRSNTTGSFWTAIGTSAGRNNTTGISWTAIGISAGFSNTTGISWTAIGINSGYSNTTGSGWVAIGTNSARYQSGTTNTDLTVFNNGTYLGSETHGTQGSSNETVIGYAAEGNGSNTVTIGSSAVTDNYFTGDIHAVGAGKGIIVTSPDGLTTLRIGIDNSGNIVTSTP